MRKGSIVALLGLAVIAGGVATAVALVPTWLPKDASREAGRIDFTFWFVIAICIAIFAIVAAVMIYAVIRFRVQEDDFEDGPPIHGHTGLEITWTAIPFVLVTAIAIVSAIVLSRNDAEAGNTLRINVTAQQFIWTFGYPDAHDATSPVLRLPEGRSVELDMRSLDVIHAFFVPEFRTNEDIVPGLVTTVHITPDRLGTFPLICNELCGLGHSLMRSQAIVMKPAAFDAWLKQQRKSAAPAPASTTGTTVDLDDPLVVLGGRPLRLQRERLLELPHAERRQRDGHGRAGSRQARLVRTAGEAAARRIRPPVDRRPERVRGVRLPERRHAGDVRAVSLEDAARRPRDVPRPVRPEEEGMIEA